MIGVSASPFINKPSIEVGQPESNTSDTLTLTTADMILSSEEPSLKPDDLKEMNPNAIVAIRQSTPQASTSPAQTSSASPASLAAELSEQDTVSTAGTTPPPIVQTQESTDSTVTSSIHDTGSSNDTTTPTITPIPQWNAINHRPLMQSTMGDIAAADMLIKIYHQEIAAKKDAVDPSSPIMGSRSNNQKKTQRTPLPDSRSRPATQAELPSRPSTAISTQCASYGGYTLDVLGLKPGFFPDLKVKDGQVIPPPKGHSNEIPSWAFLIFSVLKRVPNGMMKMDDLRGIVMEWCPAILQKAVRDGAAKLERYHTALKDYNDSQEKTPSDCGKEMAAWEAKRTLLGEENAGPKPKALKRPNKPKSPNQVCNDSCRHCLTSYDVFRHVKIGASNAGYWRIQNLDEQKKVRNPKVKKAPFKEEAEGESLGSAFGASMSSTTRAGESFGNSFRASTGSTKRAAQSFGNSFGASMSSTTRAGGSFRSPFGPSMRSTTHAKSNMDVDDDDEDDDERFVVEEPESRSSLGTSRSRTGREEPVSQSLPLPPSRGKRARKPTVPFHGGHNPAKRPKKER